MNTLIQAIFTDATCGAACWYAKEETCRCSCGGKNHGCLLDPDNETPERIVKIDGERYRLEAVGRYNEINNLAYNALLRLGWREIKTMVTYGDGTPYHYAHYANDRGSAIRVKPAAKNQLDWPEVKLSNVQSPMTPYLLWVKVNLPDPQWCDTDTCERCIDKRFTIWEQDNPPDEIEWDFDE